MLVKCPAVTCIHCKNGMCNAEAIEMVDFEYYSTKDKERKENLDDEMKCNSYKSIYKAG